MHLAFLELVSQIRTFEWVDGNQDTTDVGVNLAILPPLLQVVVDSLVCNRSEECHVGYTDLLLLEAFLPVRLISHSIRH